MFSQHLPTLFEHAWLIASLGSAPDRPNQIRSGHLLLALLTEPSLAQLAQRGSQLFAQVPARPPEARLRQAHRGLGRSGQPLPALHGRRQEQRSRPGRRARSAQAPGKTPALDQFTTNLTQRARDGKIDPVIGRDPEIRQVIDILMRRRQNNPILTGEAGVGKTAVVEGPGAAHRRRATCRTCCSGVEIHTLDMGLLQAGASVKGEFENRLKNVIDEVKRSPHADHPVHRRSAHDDRRRRRRPARTMRPTC